MESPVTVGYLVETMSQRVEVPTDNMNVTSPPAEYFWEMSAATFLYAVPSFILLILGTIGNTLSFIVFSRQNMRHSVTSVYFRILAIGDNLVLWSGSLVFFILGAFDIDIRLLSRGSCKFWIPVLLAVCYQSCWILVFIAVDRFIGVWMPHKYRKFCSQKLAIINCIVLFLVVTLTIFVFWAVALDLTEDGTQCTISEYYGEFFTNVFVWLDLVFLNLIPTFTLVALNICIIVKISQATLQRKNTMGSHNAKSPQSKQSSSATPILLLVSFVYILCTIPSSTAFLAKRAFGNSAHGQAQSLLYGRACETLYLANHAVNFIIYCVCGTGFRKELKRLFRRSKTVTSSTGTNSTAMTAMNSVRQAKYTKRNDV